MAIPHILNKIVSFILFVIFLLECLFLSTPEDFAKKPGLDVSDGADMHGYSFNENVMYEDGELLKIMESSDKTAVAAMTYTGNAEVFSEELVAEAMGITPVFRSGEEDNENTGNDSGTEDKWSVHCYYTGKDSLYHTDETNNFTLKYQVEMHFDRDIPAN